MNAFRLISVTFVVLFLIGGASAQVRLTTSGAASNPNPVALPPGNNFAVVDSSAFTDEKAGIGRFVAAIKGVNIRFEAVQKEIQTMKDRLAAIQSEASKPNAPIQKLQEEVEQLQLNLKRKGEDAQSNYDRELAAALDPIQTDITSSLNAYATSHGILMIIDVSRVPVIYTHDSIDITKDFIAEYNRTHPAAGAAPAKP
jgi:Skp family chaperone for outer membrane proteins